MGPKFTAISSSIIFASMTLLALPSYPFSKVLGEERETATPYQLSNPTATSRRGGRYSNAASTSEESSAQRTSQSCAKSTSKSKKTRVTTSSYGSSNDSAMSLLPDSYSATLDDDKEEQKVLSPEGLAVKDDLKIEFGEGIGETKSEALQEAMRDVLQKVVGVYVDSDFRVKNDDIIKDEIVTHSNGFIDHYKIMESSDAPDGRGVQVTIKAWVKMRDFVNRMKKIEPKQVVKMDGALLQSDLGNRLNAEKLLEKELGNLNPVLDFLDVALLDNMRPTIQDSTSDSVTLRYIFTIKFSKRRYYDQFIPRIVSVMDQIAKAKLKDRVIPMKVVRVESFPIQFKTGDSIGKPFKEFTIPSCCLISPAKWEGRNRNSVSIVTKISKGGVATSREWLLTERLKKVFMEFLESNDMKYRHINCVLRLLDIDGQDLGVGTVTISQDRLLVWRNYYYDQHSYGERPEFIPLLKAHTTSGDEITHESYDVLQRNVISMISIRSSTYCEFADKFIGYIDVTLDRSDVSKIKSAEIKLETNKEE